MCIIIHTKAGAEPIPFELFNHHRERVCSGGAGIMYPDKHAKKIVVVKEGPVTPVYEGGGNDRLVYNRDTGRYEPRAILNTEQVERRSLYAEYAKQVGKGRPVTIQFRGSYGSVDNAQPFNTPNGKIGVAHQGSLHVPIAVGESDTRSFTTRMMAFFPTKLLDDGDATALVWLRSIVAGSLVIQTLKNTRIINEQQGSWHKETWFGCAGAPVTAAQFGW